MPRTERDMADFIKRLCKQYWYMINTPLTRAADIPQSIRYCPTQTDDSWRSSVGEW